MTMFRCCFTHRWPSDISYCMRVCVCIRKPRLESLRIVIEKIQFNNTLGVIPARYKIESINTAQKNKNKWCSVCVCVCVLCALKQRYEKQTRAFISFLLVFVDGLVRAAPQMYFIYLLTFVCVCARYIYSFFVFSFIFASYFRTPQFILLQRSHCYKPSPHNAPARESCSSRLS